MGILAPRRPENRFGRRFVPAEIATFAAGPRIWEMAARIWEIVTRISELAPPIWEMLGPTHLLFAISMDMHYQIIAPRRPGTLDEQLDDVWQQLLAQSGLQPVASRVFLSDIQTQLPRLSGHPLWAWLGRGAVWPIEQPPLGGRKLAVLAALAPAGSFSATGTPERRLIEADGRRYLYHCARLPAEEAQYLNVREQTERLFAQHTAWLSELGLTLRDHCHRTWLFVRDIDRHYAAVVEGRNRVFEREGLIRHTHFITSTGIGGEADNARAAVAIDFFSVDHVEGVRYLQATDFLNPTYEYGVAFERGTRLTLDGRTECYISGTASIDKHGQVVHEGDVERQADRLFENIQALLADGGHRLADARYFLVYLRDVADHERIEAYMRRHFPHVPHLVMAARVCRPGWLIEAECHTAR